MSRSRRLLIVEIGPPSDIDVYRSALAAEFPDLELLTACDREQARAAAAGASAILGKAGSIPAEAVAAAPPLEWIHALTAGVDPIVAMPPQVVLTCARGVHGPQMSELALLLMMALARQRATS